MAWETTTTYGAKSPAVMGHTEEEEQDYIIGLGEPPFPSSGTGWEPFAAGITHNDNMTVAVRWTAWKRDV